MSMVGTAATRRGDWPRSRILSAVLAVSLVLNVLFVAGSRVGPHRRSAGSRSRPAFRADRRATGSRCDAARRLRQAARRAARTRRQGSATGRTALSRGLGRGRKADGRTRTRCFDCSSAAFDKRRQLNRETTTRNPRFPRDAVARAARPVCRTGARAGKLAEVAHARPRRNVLTSSRTAGRRRRRAPAGYSRGRRERDRPTRSRSRPRERPGAERRSPRARRRGRRT